MISRAKAREGRYAEWNCARIFLWYNDTQTTMHLIPLKSSFPVIPVSLPTLTFFLYISLAIQKIILLFPHLFFFFYWKKKMNNLLLNQFSWIILSHVLFLFSLARSQNTVFDQERYVLGEIWPFLAAVIGGNFLFFPVSLRGQIKPFGKWYISVHCT